jgi:hypothetical protein
MERPPDELVRRMTATLRTQRARSRQAQSGAKRVEVVLGRYDADQLFAWAKDSEITVAEAVRIAVSEALKARSR